MTDSKIYFFYGAMGSSKTLRLLTTAYNFQEKNIHFICMKSAIDDRDGVGVIHSRVGLERECLVLEQSDDPFEMVIKAKEMDPEIKKVLVDECQFLSEWQIDRLAKVVDDLDIDVMCYGLKTDFQTESFPGAKRLFEVADTLEEVKSHCECGGKAMMNARFDENGYLVLNGDQVMIGGNDLYRPLCRKCYYREADRTLNKQMEDLKYKVENKILD